MRPNYICIGVQKSGTTSLIKYLNCHPDIYIVDDNPPYNEKHFFDRSLDEGQLTNDEIKKYEESFKTDKLIVGEKTPSYCYLRYAIDRIYDYDKNMKLIIILREPISRAFSSYNMGLNFNGQTLSNVTEEQMFSKFKSEENIKLNEVKSNGTYFIARGFYDEILEYILSKFSRDKVYIGISEEINQDKLKHYNEIYDFLGATKLENLDDGSNVHVREYKKTIPKKLENYLYNIYEPHNNKLYNILGRKVDIWESYYSQLKLDMELEIKSDFDWEFYTSFYRDLSHLNTYEKAYSHWLKHGKSENRISNNKFLVKNS